MQQDSNSWSYNEFLAFLMVYGAQLDTSLPQEELEFIKTRTGIRDIETIKNQVASVSDIEALDIIESYRKKYLNTKEKSDKAREDLEGLLKTESRYAQLEKAVIHLLERII